MLSSNNHHCSAQLDEFEIILAKKPPKGFGLSFLDSLLQCYRATSAPKCPLGPTVHPIIQGTGLITVTLCESDFVNLAHIEDLCPDLQT